MFPIATAIAVVALLVCNGHAQFEEAEEAAETLRDAFFELESRYNDLTRVVGDLARQTMLQQLFVEERIRSDGDSGVKTIRGNNKGPQNYYGSSHVAGNFMSIHDHSDLRNTVGLGEFIAVLNGVEFRTRHNDYKLVMPSTTSTDYDAVEEVPFPEVPPAVSQLTDVQEQIAEMQEWFKAFNDQDTSVRDYRPYFKPVLCYLEGAWTLDDGEIDEPFSSDRHSIDASSWFELQTKVKYTTYTGSKSRLENYAYLPTTIMSVNLTTDLPNYAQWNYRILCKPTPEDVPLSELRQVDDLASRYPRGRTFEQSANTRAARYRFYEGEKDQFTKYSKIDDIFYSIPGKDNLPGDMSAFIYGDPKYKLADGLEPLQSGYYHRWFKFEKNGAMGVSEAARGFNDENMWVAQTTQPKIAPVGIEHCERKLQDDGKRRMVCEMIYTRMSWAIPLELIYLTPLLTWNPYNLEYRDDDDVAKADNRNGFSEARAFNGTFRKGFYQTPKAFFSGSTDQSDPADTVRNAMWVLDPEGNAWPMAASGTRVHLPRIGDIEKLRLRYPIAPIHGEGSSVWKELNALRDFVEDQLGENSTPRTVQFSMSVTGQSSTGQHYHEFLMSVEDYLAVRDEGKTVAVTTTQNNNHSHNLVIYYDTGNNKFRYSECDGQSGLCYDQHPRLVTPEAGAP